MAEQLLDGTDVVPVFEQVRRERVTERMAAHLLSNSRTKACDLHGALKDRFVEMMTPALSSESIEIKACRRKQDGRLQENIAIRACALAWR